MWVLRARMRPEGFVLGAAAAKFNVRLSGYPLSYYKKGKSLRVVMTGFITGEEKNKKAFIDYLKKNKYLSHFESSGDFVIIVMKQPLELEVIYNRKIIRTSPSIISPEGYLLWEVASWDKKVLMDAFNYVKEHQGAKLLQLRQEKINNITVTGIIPKVTEKQKQALKLAIDNGYYDYPKKIGLVELSKKMKLSYSTFQAHLKKAEGKLLKYTSKTI